VSPPQHIEDGLIDLRGVSNLLRERVGGAGGFPATCAAQDNASLTSTPNPRPEPFAPRRRAALELPPCAGAPPGEAKLATIEVLLRAGASAGARRNDGATALHAAAAVTTLPTRGMLRALTIVAARASQSLRTSRHSKSDIKTPARSDLTPCGTLICGLAAAGGRRGGDRAADRRGGGGRARDARGGRDDAADHGAAHGMQGPCMSRGRRDAARGAPPASLSARGRAAQGGFLIAAQALLRAGANAHAQDAAGNTPWLVAVGAPGAACEAVAEALAGRVDLCAINRDGYSAAHLAARHGRLSLLRAAVRAGADPWVSSGAGLTPLHMAAQGGHAGTLFWLFYARRGALPLGARDHSGSTALHYAAASGSGAAVRVLLELGAAPHVRNFEGRGCAPCPSSWELKVVITMDKPASDLTASAACPGTPR
jgi:ankyrin repeat protein